MLRTHYCAKINKEHIGQQISACGWVNSYRDHSNVWFVDLRDTTGLLQVVIDKKQFPDSNKLRNEFCIRVTGKVVSRGASPAKSFRVAKTRLIRAWNRVKLKFT